MHFAAQIVFARAQFARPDSQAESDVLKHRHVAEQRVVLEHETDAPLAGRAVEDIFAVHHHRCRLIAVGRVQAGDDPQQRGLAGAGGPQQRDQLAVFDMQVHVAQGDIIRERFADVPYID